MVGQNLKTRRRVGGVEGKQCKWGIFKLDKLGMLQTMTTVHFRKRFLNMLAKQLVY